MPPLPECTYIFIPFNFYMCQTNHLKLNPIRPDRFLNKHTALPHTLHEKGYYGNKKVSEMDLDSVWSSLGRIVLFVYRKYLNTIQYVHVTN